MYSITMTGCILAETDGMYSVVPTEYKEPSSVTQNAMENLRRLI